MESVAGRELDQPRKLHWQENAFILLAAASLRSSFCSETSMEPWADYICVRPAQAPRKTKFALDGSVKPKALVTTSLGEGLLAIIQPVGDVMREADENKQAPSLDAVLKAMMTPKVLKGVHDGIIYALTAGSLINLLEGMCHPLSLPATAAGRYLLHGSSSFRTLPPSNFGKPSSRRSQC